MKNIVTALAIASLFAGCYKIDITQTTHPNEAKITFSYDNLGSNPDEGGLSLAEIGGDFIILFEKEEYLLEEGKSLVIPTLLSPGEYTYYIYNVIDESVSIGYSSKAEIAPTNTAFEVDKEQEQVFATVGESGSEIITSASHALYFGAATISVAADRDHSIAATLYNVTRDLNITLKLDGDSDYLLESVTATLSGVASEWDCVNDLPSAESTAAIDFEITYNEYDDHYYLESSTKLLGTYGNNQTLSITMNYKDSNPATHIVTSDLSGDLAAFNLNKKEPLNLGATYDVPSETSANGVISGWYPEQSEDVVVK